MVEHRNQSQPIQGARPDETACTSGVLKCKNHVRFQLRGENEGGAYTDVYSMCPSDIGYNWKYARGSRFHNARKGLVVRCETDEGTTCIKQIHNEGDTI